MATVGQPLTAPEAGWRRYDDNDTRFICTGLTDDTQSSAYGGKYKNVGSGSNGKIKFKFYGTKLRFIGVMYYKCATNHAVKIDDYPVETFNAKSSTTVYQTLNYEKLDLPNDIHEVEITQGTDGSFYFDALDIDEDGYLIHPILGAPKTSLEEMKIGDYIPCRYTAFVSGQVGYFSELGTTTAPEISTTANDNTVPDGSFNFIKVDRGLLIADRNIQCSMSWNTLNSKGLIEGTNFPCILPTTSFTVNISGNGMSTTGSLISGVSTSFRTASSGWGVFQAYNDTNSSNLLSAVLRINKVRRISGTVEGAYVSFYINKLNGSMLYINIYDYDDTQYLIGFEGGSLFIPKSEGITVAMSLLNDKIYINGIIIDGIAIPGGTTTNRIMFNHTYQDGEGGSIETDVERVEYIRSANIDVSKLLPTNLLVRSLTGGVARLNTQGYPTLENANAVGGFPPTNEFDKYIINSSLNGKITPSDQSVWNANSWSHVKETALTGLKNVDGSAAPAGTSRVVRGGMNYAPYGPMGYLGQASATYSDVYTCFRPVLEYIEPDGSSKQETIWR